MTPDQLANLARPIIGIENRTAQEAFDIMVDRIRSAAPTPSNIGDAEARELREAAQSVLSFRVGEHPGKGWLRDNDASREALSNLAAALSGEAK